MGYQTQLSLKSTTPIERLLPIENSFIYLKNSRYLLSSIVFSDFDLYVQYNERHLLPAEQFSELLMNNDYWNRFVSLQALGMNTGRILYIHPLSVLVPMETTINAVLCYEFEEASIREIFSDIKLYGSGYLAACDKNGDQMLLLSSGDGIVDYELLKNLDYTEHISGFIARETREEMLVTSLSSSYNDWTYYLVQPKNQAYYSITPYQRFFTVITIGAFILGGGMVCIFSIFGGRRLNLLSNELTVKETLATSLHTQVESQKPVVLESYMRRIMEGSITTNDEMQYIIKALGLDRPDCKFHVLYTEVSPSEDANIQSSDLALCIQNYNMLVRDALRRYYPDTGYIYKPSDNAYTILIASNIYTPFEQVISENQETFIAMHNELLNKYGIWIRGGFGDRNGLLSYTWKSYQQAKEAKTITTTEKYIYSCSDFAHSSDVYYYPESLSVQLSGFISSGNTDQVSELFKLIHNENTGKRNLSYTQRHWLISDIRSTVYKKRHNIASDNLTGEKLKLLDLVDRQFEGEMSVNVLKTISLELCEIYGTNTEGNDLILKIQEYINQNYHDPELGLTKISDKFGISENYFSYLFKKELSENFSSYLERLRMAKAREMVLDSDTSLSELYQYLGYNNAASFRRAFKKNFGVSPKEMRDKVNAKYQRANGTDTGQPK